MKRVLLVGFGAEIGATLLGMNIPEQAGFHIGTILTNIIPEDRKNPGVVPMDSLYARLIMAHPQMAKDFAVDHENERLIVRGRSSKVIFGDSRDFDISQLDGRFDVCIFATSKSQIGDHKIIGRFTDVADFVIGVSEASNLPALYANLIDTPCRHLGNQAQPAGDDRVFAIGSCQSNGWHSPLRAVLELAEQDEIKQFEILGTEVDIVHPDTPTGRLGTKSVEPREQDPRNNLRPSFSQIEMAMGLLLPDAHRLNSISLRTLTQPPGFQVSRFFFRYQTDVTSRLTYEKIVESFTRTADKLPNTLAMSYLPLGSRAFEFADASATVLSSENYFRFQDNPFRLPEEQAVSELVVQSYVNNVRGYCRSALEIVKYLCVTDAPLVFKSKGA